jgi:hypothetical protein
MVLLCLLTFENFKCQSSKLKNCNSRL